MNSNWRVFCHHILYFNILIGSLFCSFLSNECKSTNLCYYQGLYSLVYFAFIQLILCVKSIILPCRSVTVTLTGQSSLPSADGQVRLEKVAIFGFFSPLEIVYLLLYCCLSFSILLLCSLVISKDDIICNCYGWITRQLQFFSSFR